MEAERNVPYSVARGSLVVDGRWLITHAEWHPCGMFGDIAQFESGVRDLSEDRKEIPGSFRLVQHGWSDFDRAGQIIARGLRKGWGTDRIGRVMDAIKEGRLSGAAAWKADTHTLPGVSAVRCRDS